MLPDPKTKTGPLLNSATGLAFISAGGLVTSKRQMPCTRPSGPAAIAAPVATVITGASV
jgi:hypothetical protein